MCYKCKAKVRCGCANHKYCRREEGKAYWHLEEIPDAFALPTNRNGQSGMLWVCEACGLKADADAVFDMEYDYLVATEKWINFKDWTSEQQKINKSIAVRKFNESYRKYIDPTVPVNFNYFEENYEA